MRNTNSIRRSDLKAIKESVKVAVNELKKSIWNRRKPKRGARYATATPQPPDNAKCGEFLKKASVRNMILNALERGDGYFFVRFGRDLSKKYAFIEETKYPLAPILPAFLIIHWADRKDGLPELCRLTPSDLTAVCIEHLEEENLQEEAVVKMRQRLKLKPFRGRKLRAKYAGGKITFPELDN